MTGFVSLIVNEKADYAIIRVGRDEFELSLEEFSVDLVAPPKSPRIKGRHSRGLVYVGPDKLRLALTGAIVRTRRERGRGKRGVA